MNEFWTNDWHMTTHGGKRRFVAVLPWLDVPPNVRSLIGQDVRINGSTRKVLSIEIVDGQAGLAVLR